MTRRRAAPGVLTDARVLDVWRRQFVPALVALDRARLPMAATTITITKGEHMRTVVVTGTIGNVNHTKGFGFIRGTDGTEYFFHRSAIPDFDTLRPGLMVQFTPTSGPKGPRAEAITIVDE